MNNLENFNYDPAKLSLATSLFDALKSIAAGADLGELNTVDFFKALEQPPEKNLGDYALPCFRFAKTIKQNPNQVAESFKAHLEASKNPWIDRIDLKGAFLNIYQKTRAAKCSRFCSTHI